MEQKATAREIQEVVNIKMTTILHLVMDNKKMRPIICKTKADLNKTFKEATKVIEVA